ncbi:fungal hydrophobin [Marasmius fiardii PR-910]|nr:fungal hydrophobin [Marasmius fiardii PR-910]
MKLTSAFVVAAATLATTVSAAPQVETNAQRMARGLPPNPPAKRAPTGTEAAKRGEPSGSSGPCGSNGSAQCCQSTGHSTDGAVGTLLKLLGINIQDSNVLIGLTCTPLTIIGGNGFCATKSVCCQDTSYGGLLAIGCVPITL